MVGYSKAPLDYLPSQEEPYPGDRNLNGLRDAIGEESFRRLMHSEVQLEMARAGVYSSPGVMPVAAKAFLPADRNRQSRSSSPRSRFIPWAQPADLNGDGRISPSEVALAESERRLEMVRAGIPLRGQDADMQWAVRPEPSPSTQEMQSWKDWAAVGSPRQAEALERSVPSRPPPLPPPQTPPGDSFALGTGRRSAADNYFSPRIEQTWPAAMHRYGVQPTHANYYSPRGLGGGVGMSHGWCHPADINQDGVVDASEAALAVSEERLRRVNMGLSPEAQDRLLGPREELFSPRRAYPAAIPAGCSRVRARSQPYFSQQAWEQWPAGSTSWSSRAGVTAGSPGTYASRCNPSEWPREATREPVAAPQQLQRPWQDAAMAMDINRDGVIDAKEAALAESERRLRRVQAESALLASKATDALISSRQAWLPPWL